jgi:hypothetical protein
MKNALRNKTIEDFFAQADVHDASREQSGGVLTCVVALVLFVVEALIVYWATYEKLSVEFALALHGIVVISLFIYSRVLLKRGSENRFALLLFMATSTTGPYGAAGVMLAIITFLIFIRRSQPFDDWFASIFPAQKISHAQRIYDDIMVGRDESSKSYSVIPFLDVLSFGSELQKRQALAKMTSSFHPNFAPAFKKALSDNSNTIRVQAATAITKIENAFMDRLMKLARVKDQFPKEPVVVKALADHYDNYAYTGLLDADREATNRRRALEHYQEYMNLEPHDLDVRTHIGRLLMRNKDYASACEWFKNAIDTGHVSQSITEWYAEALFNCGRFAELRRMSLATPPVTDGQAHSQPLPLKEALALWTASAAGGRV